MYIEKLRSLMEKAPGEAADIAEYAQMFPGVQMKSLNTHRH